LRFEVFTNPWPLSVMALQSSVVRVSAKLVHDSSNLLQW
jgi:hypothetical protein